jgi:hypothetical protein
VCGGFFVLCQQHKKHQNRLDLAHYQRQHRKPQLVEVGTLGFEGYTL